MVKYTGKGKGKGIKKASRGRKAKPLYNMKSLTKAVSRVVLKKAESKHKHSDFGKTELYHNTMSVLKINDTSTMPTQGTSDSQRVGDNINLGAFYLRLLCGQKLDRHNVNWKFYILKVPKDASVSYTTFFDSVTGNSMLDSPNKDKVKVLYAKTIKKLISPDLSGVGGADKELTFTHKIWLPYRRLLKFQADAGTVHDDGDIYLVTFVYDAYGSLFTDNIAYHQMTSTIYYKDP